MVEEMKLLKRGNLVNLNLIEELFQTNKLIEEAKQFPH